MEKSEIMRVLPHREPMLLVDDVVEVRYGEYVKGIRKVREEEPWFQGHYPNNPILPGAILIEIMAQVSCFLYYAEDKIYESYPYLAKVESCTFLHTIFPSDELVIETKMQQELKEFFKASCIVKRKEKIVAKANLVGYRG